MPEWKLKIAQNHSSKLFLSYIFHFLSQFNFHGIELIQCEWVSLYVEPKLFGFRNERAQNLIFSLPTFPIYDKILRTEKKVRQAERAFTLPSDEIYNNVRWKDNNMQRTVI